MAKNNNSTSNIKIQNEGKNLINNNLRDNQDISNNYESNVARNLFANDNKSPHKFIKEANLTMQPRMKDKNGIISREILNPENDVDINNNDNIDHNNSNKKKEKTKLPLSLFYYKENKIFTKFRRIYKKIQIYISIFLAIFSSILFIISMLDFMKKMKNKKKFLLCNSFIFIFEILCAILNIIFHITYYSFNVSNNNLIFIVISCIIFAFGLIYTHTYLKQKVDIINIVFYVGYNFSMILINLIYLFKSYSLTREQFKVQQNIEDIMNFTMKNDKNDDNLQENKVENKNKGIELVEEENQNNFG